MRYSVIFPLERSRRPTEPDWFVNQIEPPSSITSVCGLPLEGARCFDDFAGLRVELADGPVAVSRVPDLAFLVDQQPVRMRAGGKIPFVEFLRAGVKTRDAVALHHRDIDVAVRTRGGIAGEFRRRHRPFGNLSGELLRPRGDAVIRAAGKRAGATQKHWDRKKDRSLHGNLRSKANRGRV